MLTAPVAKAPCKRINTYTVAGLPIWCAGLMEAVRQQRERPPCYWKDKIAVILRREGWQRSTSTVGRFLGSLKRRGAMREPPRPRVARRRRRAVRP